MKIEGYGMSLEIPKSWNGRTYRVSDELAPSLEASSVPLAPVGQELRATFSALSEGDFYVLCSDLLIPVEKLDKHESDWKRCALPLRVTLRDVSEEYMLQAPAAAMFPSIINGRSIVVMVAFGGYPSHSELAGLNDVLSSFEVEQFDSSAVAT